MVGQMMCGAFLAVVTVGITASVADAQWPAQSRPPCDPTVDNPHWRTDPFKGTPVSTLNNPHWHSDPFGKAPKPR